MPGLRGFVRKLSLAATLTAAGAGASAQAQAPGPDGGGLARAVGTPVGVNSLMVLMAPAVQTELKLTDDQKTQVFELAREAQQRGRERLQAMLQSGNPQAFLAAGLQIRKENEAAAGKLLKPEQKARVDQIMLQVEGPLAVVHPDVAEKLNMTPKQNQQVQATMMQMALAVRQMVMEQAQAGNGFAALGPAGLPREAMTRVRAAATQQLGRILDAKQKFRFNAMLGAPFDLAKIDPELAQPAAPPASATATATASGAGAGKTEKTARGRRKGATRASAAKAGGDEETGKP